MAEPVITDAGQPLTPCPFCGNRDNDFVDHRWVCNCCEMEGPPSRVDPDAVWNRRWIDPTPIAAAVAADRAQRGADAQGTSINVNDLIADIAALGGSVSIGAKLNMPEPLTDA